MKLLTFAAILAFLAFTSPSFSQEIEAIVQVNMEQIAPENRVNIGSMENDVKNYINNQRFSDINWEGQKIPVEINIFITGGNRTRYSAKLFIASKRYLDASSEGTSMALKIVDQDWSFDYAMGANLSYNASRFNEFTSLLDYYMLIIIGYDMDSWGELDGTNIYEKAKQICQLGASAGGSGYKTLVDPGKFSRYSIASELTDVRNEPLRKMIFSYFVDGLSKMSTDKVGAMAQIAGIIKEMADFKQNKMIGPSVLMQTFFDAKCNELCSIYKGNKEYIGVFTDLMYMDPARSTVYQEARDAR